MFDGKYIFWNKKRIKGILDHYGYKFFINKKILDLGCGHGEIGATLHRLGADVTAVDAREEHLKLISKKYPTIKTLKLDLDKNFSFNEQNYFDLTLNLGLLCHLENYEQHLKKVCYSTTHLILETAVYDSNQENCKINLYENKDIYDLSFNGVGSRPTSKNIEKILKECGMNFSRIDSGKFNSGSYMYNWIESNDNSHSLDKRRIWFCSKDPNFIGNIDSHKIENNELIDGDICFKPEREAMINFQSKNLYENNIKFILNLFSSKYFNNKSILEISSWNGGVISNFINLGAFITLVDSDQEKLNNFKNQYPKSNNIIKLDNNSLEINAKFDFTLSIDKLHKINNIENYINLLTNKSMISILESKVLDSSNDIIENNIPSASIIEKYLSNNNVHFIRADNSKLNFENNIYNWNVGDPNNNNYSLRRFWICCKHKNIIDAIKRGAVLKEENENILPALSLPNQDIELKNNIKEEKNILPLLNQDTEVKNNLTYNAIEIKNINITQESNKKFVIVIPSYKNAKWAEKNILSALNQNYENYRIIYTDDCSPDNTFDIVTNVTNSHKNKNKAKLIRNPARCGALENLYNMIHSCDDDEIILTLDGDDWLADNEVLNKLNKVYQEDVWMTYGQYKNYPPPGLGIARQIPNNIIQANNYRQYAWCSSHLRTFYTWLFKNIKKEDLLYEGKFAPSAWDMYIMFPMLEMSGNHAKFINEVLYIYNLENPINDHKVDQKLQQNLDRVCRGKQKYSLLNSPNISTQSLLSNIKKKIGLLLIATGKYDVFIQQLLESADKYFLNNKNYEVTYFIFTDSDKKYSTSRKYKTIKIDHKSFPYASMDRFKHFTNNADKLKDMDYIFYTDVDSKFVDNVSEEILGNLVGVRHCGFYNGGGTFENNTKSVFYIDPKKYKYYFGGGFSGGKTENYLELSKWCYEMIEKDLANNIIPRFHDETSINRYFLDHEPSTILSPSYHYPESNLSHYFEKWRPHKFEPKILLLDKNHKEIRK